jgi:hypothetical protein
VHFIVVKYCGCARTLLTGAQHADDCLALRYAIGPFSKTYEEHNVGGVQENPDWPPHLGEVVRIHMNFGVSKLDG